MYGNITATATKWGIVAVAGGSGNHVIEGNVITNFDTDIDIGAGIVGFTITGNILSASTASIVVGAGASNFYDITGNVINVAITDGGTGTSKIVDGTGSTTFTPAAACGTATFTVNSAKYKRLQAKITWFEIDIVIATLGTCSGNNLTFSLPFNAATSAGWAGMENTLTVFVWGCRVLAASATATCAKYDGSVTWLATQRLILAGTYENQ
jgi:hypothetical protein